MHDLGNFGISMNSGGIFASVIGNGSGQARPVRGAVPMNRNRVMADCGFPENMTILVTDLEAFGRLRNPQQVAVRRSMYENLEEAFRISGIPWQSCTREDRGDGVLMLVPGTVSRVRVLARVLPAIVDKTAAAGAGDWQLPPTKMRMALHSGDVHRDGHGFAGADLNQAFRLVESEELRHALRSTAKQCAIMVSDPLYQATILQCYPGIDSAEYHPVPVHTKEADVTAWLRIPGDDLCARRISADRAVALAVPAGNIAARDMVPRGFWRRGRK
jgi:hypothetical protein